MGDVADMMTDGTLCVQCGVFIGDCDGYPRRCPDCSGEDKQARVEFAADQFEEVRAKASEHGLKLKRCTNTHYQLTDGNWLLNLYPGNCRIYHDRNRGSIGPFLNFVGIKWTLAEVVNRAIAKIEATRI